MSNDTTGDEDELVFDATEQGDSMQVGGGGNIDAQIATAKKYPRSIDKCLKEARTLATKNEDVAKSCYYALPRGNDTIKGPSIRFAEILAYCWGNLRVMADIVDETHDYVEAVGRAIDLEKNTAASKTTTRNILRSDGSRYPEHMITTTKNAAMSVVFRNAVFSVIPKAYWGPIYEDSLSASLGGKETIEERRDNMVNWFKNRGVTEAQIFQTLNVNGMEDITEEEIIDLGGIANMIKEQDVTVEQIFGNAGNSRGATDLNQYIQNIDDEEDEQPQPTGGDEETTDNPVQNLEGPHLVADLDGVEIDDVPEPSSGAKKLAEEYEINLDPFAGTGKNGRVVKSDVQDMIDNNPDLKEEDNDGDEEPDEEPEGQRESEEPSENDDEYEEGGEIETAQKMGEVKSALETLGCQNALKPTLFMNFGVEAPEEAKLGQLRELNAHLQDLISNDDKPEFGQEGEIVLP